MLECVGMAHRAKNIAGRTVRRASVAASRIARALFPRHRNQCSPDELIATLTASRGYGVQPDAGTARERSKLSRDRFTRRSGMLAALVRPHHAAARRHSIRRSHPCRGWRGAATVQSGCVVFRRACLLTLSSSQRFQFVKSVLLLCGSVVLSVAQLARQVMDRYALPSRRCEFDADREHVATAARRRGRRAYRDSAASAGRTFATVRELAHRFERRGTRWVFIHSPTPSAQDRRPRTAARGNRGESRRSALCRHRRDRSRTISSTPRRRPAAVLLQRPGRDRAGVRSAG